MRHFARAATLLCLAATAAGQAPPAGTPMAGFVRYEFNKWMFHPCPPAAKGRAAAAPLPFIDASPSGLAFRAIQERWKQSIDPLRGVYLEFGGYTESGRATALDLHRALGWVGSCDERPRNIAPNTVLWAAGHEPSWTFRSEGNAARFDAVGQAPISLPASALRTAGATHTFEAPGQAPRFRIEFTQELCSDTMAEAAFGRRVVAAAHGRLYVGCGLVRAD